MQLNDANRALVRTAVLADATATGYFNSKDAYSLRDWFNLPKAPAVLAWRTAAPPHEIDDAPDYSIFDTIVAGKRDSWKMFLAYPRNFTRNKTRKWVTDVWGAAIASSNGRAILLAGTENATNAQAAIGGTSKTTDTVAALDRNFSGLCDMQDAEFIINNVLVARVN